MSEVINTEILEAPTRLVEFDAVEAGLADLRKDLAGVQFDVTTTAGDKAARAARQRCVSIRTSADAAYADWNKPMLEKQRDMRAKLGEIKEAVKEVEDPIDAQIKAEEKRKAEEKAEREAAEAARKKAVDERIWAIRQFAASAVGLSSIKIAAMIETLDQDEDITLERFGDRAGEAEIAKQQTLEKMQEMHAAAVAHEAEQEKLAEERAKLAEQQAEQKRRDDEAAAALAKQRAELKAQQDAIDRQKQELIDAQESADRKEQDRLDAIAAEEQAKIDAEAEEERKKAEAKAAAAQKKADEEAAETARRERVQFEKNGPGAGAIIETLAQHYSVSQSVVISWIKEMDLTDAVAALTKEAA